MALDGIARQPACLRSSSDTASGECRWKTRAKTHNHAFTCWYADTHQLYYLLGFGFLSDVEDPAMCPEHESDHFYRGTLTHVTFPLQWDPTLFPTASTGMNRE